MVTRDYLDLTLSLRGSSLSVVKTVRGRFNRPRAIAPRFHGPFTVKIYSRSLLRDIVRFTFPLTGAAGSGADLADSLGRGLARGVSAEAKVRVPFDDSVTAIIVENTRARQTVAVDLEPLRSRSGPAELAPPVPHLRSAAFRAPSVSEPPAPAPSVSAGAGSPAATPALPPPRLRPGKMPPPPGRSKAPPAPRSGKKETP